MKRIFIFSLLSVALLTSCKFRTPKSEQDAINNRIVEKDEFITVRTPAIVFNVMSMDKDLDGKDSILRSNMSEKYKIAYSELFGSKYEIVPTKCTDLSLIDDSLSIKFPNVMIGNRKVRMVVFLPGKEPLFFDKLLEPSDLLQEVKLLEASKVMTQDEKMNQMEEEKERKMKEELLMKEGANKPIENSIEEKKSK